MLSSLKRAIRQSPLGPLAIRINACFAPRDGVARAQNVSYDEETVEIMRRVLRPDSSCIDVGAHRGNILDAMVRFSPMGTHFAFEPLPHLAAHLRGSFPHVKVYQAAVSDYTGTTTFVHVENDPAYSGLRPRIYDRPDPVLKPLTVDVVQLDDVIPDEQHVAFLKLDIEGGEFHALRGASRTIRRSRPVIVFEAGLKSTGQYGVGPGELYGLIREHNGYHVSTMKRWLSQQPPYDETAFCQNWRGGDDFCFVAYSGECR